MATGSMVNIERFQNEVHDFIINQSLDEIVGEKLTLLGEEVKGKDSGIGSTYAGNVSHVVPTAHAYIKKSPG